MVGCEQTYAKLYLDTVVAFKGLPKEITPFIMETLRYMALKGEFGCDFCLITLTGYHRERISQHLGISDSMIMKNLRRLVDSGIFLKVARSVYRPNPEIFGELDWRYPDQIGNLMAAFDFTKGTIKLAV